MVQPGDSVFGIARKFGIDMDVLTYDNQLVYPYALVAGQSLLIRGEDDILRENTETEMKIRSNGYAYPFISRWVLEQTLPFLTDLSIFSYGFTMEGHLVPPLLIEDWMIELAASYGTSPVLTLTPLGPDGRFNNQLITRIVQNEQNRERLLASLLEVMREKGYRGLDIDFEYIFAQDRDAFTEFVRVCVQRMHEEGYRVSVALAPKVSAQQEGLLYEGKDYRALGEAADAVLLMTYEWGYTYGPPMAVAPVNKVRQVVEYAVTEIPTEKINLGIPNYGYDWPLPFAAGETRARTLGNVEAVRLADTYGVPIYFDETAQSPFFYYESGGVRHEVWFEDVRSLQAKFDLIREFHLMGAGYWNIMQFFRANWILLDGQFSLV